MSGEAVVNYEHNFGHNKFNMPLRMKVNIKLLTLEEG